MTSIGGSHDVVENDPSCMLLGGNEVSDTLAPLLAYGVHMCEDEMGAFRSQSHQEYLYVYLSLMSIHF